MLKLYRFTAEKREYWETWENGDGSHSIHWGELGHHGKLKIVKSSILRKAEVMVKKESSKKQLEGFREIRLDDHAQLFIEYDLPDYSTVEDIEKRQRLEQRLNETLGWAGLGHCDGGSNGRRTMDVANFVVDYDLASDIIKDDLADTEFADYSRIYAGEKNAPNTA